METQDIEAAFKLFNISGTGTMSKAELYDILMYEGSERSIPQGADMARSIIAKYDSDGDGELSLADFVNAVRTSTLGDDIQCNESYQVDLYDSRAKPHCKAIQALFDMLDVSLTGKLSVDELKAAVAFYEGAEFDEDQFLSWYETNHAINASRLGAMRLDQLAKATSGFGDGQLDYTEFSWYIVEAASADPAQMAGTIEAFGEAIQYVSRKRRLSKGMPDATFLPGPVAPPPAMSIRRPSGALTAVACTPSPAAACAPSPAVACAPSPAAACAPSPAAACAPSPAATMKASSSAAAYAPTSAAVGRKSRRSTRLPLNVNKAKRASNDETGVTESQRPSTRRSGTRSRATKEERGGTESHRPSARGSGTPKKGKKTNKPQPVFLPFAECPASTHVPT